MQSSAHLDFSMDGFMPDTPAAPKRRQSQAEAPAEAPRQKRKPTPSQRPEPPRRKKPVEPRLNPIIEFFRSPQTRIGAAVTLMIMAVVWVIVAINYFKTGAADQSLVAANTIAQVADSAQGAENIGGAFGAKLAHLLMVDGLGMGSLILVVYLACLSLALFGVVKIKFWAFTFKCLFSAIALSVILGLFTYNVDSTIHWGGNHGRYVNQWLFHISNVLGAVAMSVFLIGLLASIYFVQLRNFYINISGKMAKARAAMADAAARERNQHDPLADVPGDTSVVADASESAADTAVPPPSHESQYQPLHSDPMVGFSIDDESEEEPAPQPMPITQEQQEYAIAANSIAPPLEIKVDTPKSEPVFTINAPAPDEATDLAELAGNNDAPQPSPLDIRDELSRYAFPTADLLIDRPIKTSTDIEEQESNKDLIIRTFESFGISIASITATIGPTITLYEIVPAEGVRINQIRSLEDDIARVLAAKGIRIIAPIPGKGTVGVEVPNNDPQIVSMHSVITSPKFTQCNMALPMALGRTINNEVFIADLAKMPHLLVAGATGQGKSVGLNCIIASLLYKKHPGELKFVLMDPKMVEFSLYNKLEKHFLAKLPEEEEAVVTDPNKALTTLASLCVEMDRRYDLLKQAQVRTIAEYNAKFCQRRLNPENGHQFMPYIVVIVDEFADLVITAGKDILVYIARIAQKARAVGMHMIIATQRPSTDVINGMIKANFPARIAFRVASSIDSRTILDGTGANRLIGRGDMLFSINSTIERVQCAFIDTPEVEDLVDHIANQISYPSAYELPEPQPEGGTPAPGSVDLSKRDELFDDCARFLATNTTASVSLLQRRFGIGYAKAGKIMDQLEAAGIVGPGNGQKPRPVHVDSTTVEDVLRSL